MNCWEWAVGGNGIYVLITSQSPLCQVLSAPSHFHLHLHFEDETDRPACGFLRFKSTDILSANLIPVLFFALLLFPRGVPSSVPTPNAKAQRCRISSPDIEENFSFREGISFLKTSPPTTTPKANLLYCSSSCSRMSPSSTNPYYFNHRAEAGHLYPLSTPSEYMRAGDLPTTRTHRLDSSTASFSSSSSTYIEDLGYEIYSSVDADIGTVRLSQGYMSSVYPHPHFHPSRYGPHSFSLAHLRRHPQFRFQRRRHSHSAVYSPEEGSAHRYRGSRGESVSRALRRGRTLSARLGNEIGGGAGEVWGGVREVVRKGSGGVKKFFVERKDSVMGVFGGGKGGRKEEGRFREVADAGDVFRDVRWQG
ncbi:hypothetical protein K402DRAFT_78672 [Aulographum hederae CBS 113979]|uniref:Uncharacterized protein n=1 Tax=Aulographum hederae CBS 113979 TaxID=1176131 RepID=A0A6G1HFY5_9PEZI|nr:hypothetical protein K402DRAFT_78672 [Aulographum hederae CBS 113979]